jgi:hypothetical protein
LKAIDSEEAFVSVQFKISEHNGERNNLVVNSEVPWTRVKLPCGVYSVTAFSKNLIYESRTGYLNLAHGEVAKILLMVLHRPTLKEAPKFSFDSISISGARANAVVRYGTKKILNNRMR